MIIKRPADAVSPIVAFGRIGKICKIVSSQLVYYASYHRYGRTALD